MEEALHGAAFKLQTLIRLQLYGLVTSIEYFCECPHHVRGGFTLNGFGPATPTDHIDGIENVLEAIILTGIGLTIHKARLPLVVDTTCYIVTRRIALRRWLEERVGRLAF